MSDLLTQSLLELTPIRPGVDPATLWYEVAEEVAPGVPAGQSNRQSQAALIQSLIDGGALVELNIIQRLNPRGAYNAGTTYSLSDFVKFAGGNYAYINAIPAAGNTPPDPVYWLLISEDGADAPQIHFVTAAPANSLGEVGDVAIRDNGQVYEKTGATTWTSRLDALTQAEGDARYPLRTDTDPYPQYQTQAEGDDRYSQRSNNLSDLANAGTARTNLGLGTAAVLNVASSGNAASNQVVKGDDTRLGAGSLTAREIDGTPSFTATTLEFPNGTLTDQGGGVARYTPTEVGGSGGLTWQTTTTVTNLAASNGYRLNSTNLEHTLPASATLGQEIELIGVNGWSAKTQSGLVYFPNNTSNTGVRSVSGSPRACAILRALGGADWMALQTEGVELYTVSTSGPGAGVAENLRVALLAEGYTMTSTEITALTNLVNAINDQSVWSPNVFGLWPMLGNTAACQAINAANIGVGTLTFGGTVTHSAANGAVCNPGNISTTDAILDANWTSSNFRGAWFGVANVARDNNVNNPIWSLDGLDAGRMAQSPSEIVAPIHSAGGGGSTPFLSGTTFTGTIGLTSRPNSSNIDQRTYINNESAIVNTNLAKTNQNKFKLLTIFGSTKAATIRGWMLLNSASGLNDTQETAINTAWRAYLTAIGRN